MELQSTLSPPDVPKKAKQYTVCILFLTVNRHETSARKNGKKLGKQLEWYPNPGLTLFIVVEDLHLALLRSQQGLCDLGQGALHGPGPHQELAGARLLHDLSSREAKHLAEAFVAVDDGTVLHLGVGNQKLSILLVEFPDDGVQVGVLERHMSASHWHFCGSDKALPRVMDHTRESNQSIFGITDLKKKKCPRSGKKKKLSPRKAAVMEETQVNG